MYNQEVTIKKHTLIHMYMILSTDSRITPEVWVFIYVRLWIPYTRHGTVAIYSNQNRSWFWCTHTSSCGDWFGSSYNSYKQTY